jgi:purine-binding chemotaxis protein CheW
VLRLVVFDLDGQAYAIPLPSVERVLPMVAVSPLPKAPAIALGVINLHGQILPVLDIRRRFGLPPREYGLTARLLVARTSQRTLAMPVDEVMGVSEVATEAITSPDAVLPGLGMRLGSLSYPERDCVPGVPGDTGAWGHVSPR